MGGIGKDISEQSRRSERKALRYWPQGYREMLVFTACSYNIDDVIIDTPDDKSRQEGPRYRNL
jgi:hypothetical protein